LEGHHDDAPELWVGFHKKDSGRPSISWPEAVDEALCFGWIDGVRKRIDDSSPSYRRAAIWGVVSAKREETRARRLETLIADSARGRTIPPLTRP
jgi:uncharacterized protein YdeI (YjbR/CyaY-like superfamily)